MIIWGQELIVGFLTSGFGNTMCHLKWRHTGITFFNAVECSVLLHLSEIQA